MSKKNGSTAAIRKLPRLNRKGNGIRNHKLNPDSLTEIVVEEEVEELRAKDGSRKRRPGFKRAPPEVTKEGLINLDAFPTNDPKLVHLQGKIEELNEEMLEDGRRSRGMILEEKIFILQAYYNKKWGPKRIAKLLGRSSSNISRFIDKYRSTTTLARLHIEAQAENLAKRVTKQANVEESMEILDRIDALPKKDRKTTEGNSFNIIVGMPGAPGTRGTIQVPSQKQIEAAREQEE